LSNKILAQYQHVCMQLSVRVDTIHGHDKTMSSRMNMFIESKYYYQYTNIML